MKNKKSINFKCMGLRLSLVIFSCINLVNCGYLKINLKKLTENTLFSSNSGSYNLSTSETTITLMEGSPYSFLVGLNQPADFDIELELNIENTQGLLAQNYFNLNQTKLIIPKGERELSINLIPIDDTNFNNQSQWIISLISQKSEVISDIRLDLTLIDNDQVFTSVFGKIRTNLSISTPSMETANALQILSDGKLITVGSTDVNGNQDLSLIRYLNTGALDLSFGSNGKVTTDYNTGSIDEAFGVKVYKNGRVLVVGTSTSNGNSDIIVLRYTAKGALDSTFGKNGKISLSATPTSNDYSRNVIILSSGKILVGGQTDANGVNDFFLAQFESDGSPDLLFGNNGKVILDGSGNDLVSDMKVLSNGKILIAGSTLKSSYDFSVLRLLSNGTLDTSFGGGLGKINLDIFPGNQDFLSSLEIQTDGKILLAGRSSSIFGILSSDVALVRLTSSGALDGSFGVFGIKIYNSGENISEFVSSMQVLQDGNIILGGYRNEINIQSFLLKFNPSGELVNTFGDNGRVFLDSITNKNRIQDFKIQSDNKIICMGFLNGDQSDDFMLLRYLDNGSLDSSFGVEGKTITDIGKGSNDILNSLKVQSDGKVLLGGTSILNSSSDKNIALTRYLSNGTLDYNFGNSGKLILDIGQNTQDDLENLKILEGKKILVIGSTEDAQSSTLSDFTLVRLLENGDLDLSFGINGKVITDVQNSSQDRVISSLILNNGKILLLGTSNNETSSEIVLVRYLQNGLIDTTFANNGKKIWRKDEIPVDEVITMKQQLDGKIIISGFVDYNDSTDIVLFRINETGVLDTTFGIQGVLVNNFGGQDYIKDIAIREDGKILILGSSLQNDNKDVLIARYLNNGNLDTTFGLNGFLLMDLGVISIDEGQEIYLDGNNKIFIGASTNAKGKYSVALFSLLQDGALDSTFGTSGYSFIDNFTISPLSTSPFEINREGSIIFGTTSKDFEFNSFDFTLMKFNRNGLPN